MKVTIPEVVLFSSKLLYWKKDEELKPKTINLTIAAGFNAKIGAIESSSDQLKTELKAAQAGKYELVVSPTAAAQGTVVLKIHCDVGDGISQTYEAFVRLPGGSTTGKPPTTVPADQSE